MRAPAPTSDQTMAEGLQARLRFAFYGTALGAALSAVSIVLLWLCYLVDPVAVERRLHGPFVAQAFRASMALIGECGAAGFLYDQCTTTTRSVLSASVIGGVAGALMGHRPGGGVAPTLLSALFFAAICGPLGGYICRGLSLPHSESSS